LVDPPNFGYLKVTTKINDEIQLYQIFLNLINQLSAYINLEVINKKFRIHFLETIENLERDAELFSYGVIRRVEDGIYHVKLYKEYQKFFPFFLLQSAYFAFVPDSLKHSHLVDFALIQLVEIDLKEFELLEDWKLIAREKYIRFTREKFKLFRLDKFLELGELDSKPPLRYFFENIRNYSNLDLDETDHFDDLKIFDTAFKTPIYRIRNDELAETLRILAQIFYRVKNVDSLKGYYDYFSIFKEQGIIQTNLSYRKFRKNLRWINKSGRIAPSYYSDWKAMDMAVILCYLKFNPQLDKVQIDKIIYKMPFIIIPKLSITNFAVELSAYFVIPRVYIKDLFYIIDKLERSGYIINRYFSIAKQYTFDLNLNYFLESYKKGQILEPNYRNDSKDYELEFKQKYHKKFVKYPFSLLHFLILDRVRFFSYTGLSFSRRKEFSSVIKSDYNDFIIDQNHIIEELEVCLDKLQESPSLRNDFQVFLDRNRNFGFFYIKEELEKWVNYFQIIEKKSNFFNIFEFKEFVEKENVLKLIDSSGIFSNINADSYGFKKLFLDYLNANEKYHKEVERLQFFNRFLIGCSYLKIFNILKIEQLIEEPEVLEKIIRLKKERLNELQSTNNLHDLSHKTIKHLFEDFINKEPQILKPYLINTILLWMTSYFPELILKNTSEVKVIIQKLKSYFPQIYYYETVNPSMDKEYIFLSLFIPNITSDEKIILLSALNSMFKDNIISFKRFPWTGFLETFTRRDFYDFKKKEFFYTKDLFSQYYIFIKKVLGDVNSSFPKTSVNGLKLWSINKGIKPLIDMVNTRLRSEDLSFEMENLRELKYFNKNLEIYFSAIENYVFIKKRRFFHQFIDSIRFLPAFDRFGFSQYFLYITPFDFDEIDMKLLLINTFQRVQYNASINSSNSLLIRYLFPYNDPNNSYLNWLRGQNKLREYCFFKIESFSQILQFNSNISSDGWYFDSNNFKMYIQNILFNPDFSFHNSELKQFQLDGGDGLQFVGPDTKAFQSLVEVYNRDSVDVKKKLSFNSPNIFNKMHYLIKNKLVFPYLTFKNLGFKEIIHFLLLNIKSEALTILKNIFQYFNLVYLYDIKGEYYIHGFNEKKSIVKGLMVILYLPECELAEFLRIFEYVFQYLKVEKYLIFTDLVDGEFFLKLIIGNNRILDKYNPLTNLIWSKRKKKWSNHTLFSQEFNFLYPDLLYSQKEDHKGLKNG
jgi:hypothetical protein